MDKRQRQKKAKEKICFIGSNFIDKKKSKQKSVLTNFPVIKRLKTNKYIAKYDSKLSRVIPFDV